MPDVLLVGDDLSVLKILARLLRLQAHHVVVSESAGPALELLRRQPFDFVLLFLKRSGETGLDFIRQVRLAAIDAPVIVMTDFVTIDSAVQAIKLGALAYIDSPPIDRELERSAQIAFANRSKKQEVRVDEAARWAKSVALVLQSPHDVNTIAGWARLVGVAPETIRGWCKIVKARPKPSLDLSRLTRAIWQARLNQWPVERLLNAADHRTIERWLKAGGLANAADFPTVEQFLERQSIIADPLLLNELRRTLGDLGMNLLN